MTFVDSVLIFFFRQKTAYELLISDWSSYVCSSDLRHTDQHHHARIEMAAQLADTAHRDHGADAPRRNHQAGGQDRIVEQVLQERRQQRRSREQDHADDRSEEHTSELQSLMRISSAVFCLKKKNIPTIY